MATLGFLPEYTGEIDAHVEKIRKRPGFAGDVHVETSKKIKGVGHYRRELGLENRGPGEKKYY